jgi:hypothetical protein
MQRVYMRVCIESIHAHICRGRGNRGILRADLVGFAKCSDESALTLRGGASRCELRPPLPQGRVQPAAVAVAVAASCLRKDSGRSGLPAGALAVGAGK